MEAKVKRRKQAYTSAERRALVASLSGKYAWVKASSEDFLRERREETAREEAKLSASHPPNGQA